jgi:hypothetical protein
MRVHETGKQRLAWKLDDRRIARVFLAGDAFDVAVVVDEKALVQNEPAVLIEKLRCVEGAHDTSPFPMRSCCSNRSPPTQTSRTGLAPSV